jgi:hypothetical protein
MGMGRGGSEHCWKVTSGGSAEHVSSVAKPRRGGVALEKRPSTRKYDTGCRGEERRTNRVRIAESKLQPEGLVFVQRIVVEDSDV